MNIIRQRVEAEASLRQAQQAMQEAQVGATARVHEAEAIKKEVLKAEEEFRERMIVAKAAVAAAQQSLASLQTAASQRREHKKFTRRRFARQVHRVSGLHARRDEKRREALAALVSNMVAKEEGEIKTNHNYLQKDRGTPRDNGSDGGERDSSDGERRGRKIGNGRRYSDREQNKSTHISRFGDYGSHRPSDVTAWFKNRLDPVAVSEPGDNKFASERSVFTQLV